MAKSEREAVVVGRDQQSRVFVDVRSGQFHSKIMSGKVYASASEKADSVIRNAERHPVVSHSFAPKR